MPISLTSIQRADNKVYRMYRVAGPTVNSEYEIVESQHGRADRVICRYVKYNDALLMVEALNNLGSKASE